MIEEFLNSNLYTYIVGIVIFLLCFIYTISPYLEISNGIDLQIEITPVPFEEISKTAPGEPSAAIRERVIAARKIQELRYKSEKGIYCNAQMTPKLIARYAVLDETSLAMLKTAMTRFDLSARAYDRILKVARTIADLDSSENIQFQHIAEAIGYRNLDRESWGT